MSLAMTLFGLLSAWIAVALALLWGALRIARRHALGQSVQEPSTPKAPLRLRANSA